ncbi:MAG: DNA polymerase III subunit delta [Pseudolabrys sp.]
MTALKPFEVDGFVTRPDSARPVVLVFGPDAGLVRERVEALIRASVENPDDPFALARIDSEELGANPSRLADEANTVPLFGGRRAVLLKVNSRHNIVPSVEAILDAPPSDCRVIIEAGDLKKNAPLRTVCEKSKIAVALPCYADGEREIGRLIDAELRDANMTIAPDARAALASLLGGDRMASRNELRKLTLYARGKSRVELDDVQAVVTDASDQALDGVLDAAFAGRTAEVEIEFKKALASVSRADAVVSAALRHVASLHRMRLAMDDGSNADDAMMRGAPPVHFRRKPLVEMALRNWNAPRLARTMEQLADASLETRRQPALADVIAQRALLSIAVTARRRDA